MINTKYKGIWRLLNEYNFEIDICKHRDIVCCICKSLLKNAQQSICGCLFCYECIKNYLVTDEKYCPGRPNGCQELIVNVGQSIQTDHSANKKVSSVVVKCPIEFCEFKNELKYIEEHMESHGDSGNCNQETLLKELFENLRKEVSTIKEDIQQFKKESISKDITIMKIRDEMEEFRNFCEIQKTEFKTLQGKIANFEVGTVTNNNTEANDDIDWELEIFTDMDVDCQDLNNENGKQTSVKEPSLSTSHAEKSMQPYTKVVPSKHVVNGSSAVLTEIQKQIKDLKKCQNDMKGELIRLKSRLSKLDNEKDVETIDLTFPDVTSQSKQDSKDEKEQPVEENKASTSKRKLKRELPKIVSNSNDSAVTTSKETESVTKVSSTPKAPVPTTKNNPAQKVTEPSSAASSISTVINSKTNVSTASKVSPASVTPSKTGSSVMHPVVLLRNSTRAPAIKKARIRIPKGRGAPEWHQNKMDLNSRFNVNRSNAISWIRQITPFDLRIENFLEKRLKSKQGFNQSIFSQHFFSGMNGYKLCLRVDPNGFSTHLGVYFCLLKGEFDDHLPWPMKAEITISLIDQISNKSYTSRTFDYDSAPDNWKYVFNRPTIDQGFWFGTPQFIHFEFLFNNPSLFVNDSILIRCATGKS